MLPENKQNIGLQNNRHPSQDFITVVNEENAYNDVIIAPG
jgi:hypothetical protein